MSRIDYAYLERIKTHPDYSDWTPMLKRLAEGASTEEVAEQFYIALKTVGYRTARVRKMLGVSKTAVALAMAASIGLITCTELDQAMAAKRWERVVPVDRLITELFAYGFTNSQVETALGFATGSMEYYLNRTYRAFICPHSKNVLLPRWVWATSIRLDKPTELELTVLRHATHGDRLSAAFNRLTPAGVNLILRHLAAKMDRSLSELIATEQRSIA